MLEQTGEFIGKILFLIIILAIVAVIVQRGNAVTRIITSAGNLFSGIVRVVVSPVTT